MEAQGLLACLVFLNHAFPTTPAVVYGDSSLIIRQALQQYRCQAPHLKSLIASIRAQGQPGRLISLHHVRREFNRAPDALCNWIMDRRPPSLPQYGWLSSSWPCHAPYSPPTPPPPAAAPHLLLSDSTTASYRWQFDIVLADFHRVAHLVRSRFLPRQDHRVVHAPVRAGGTVPSTITTAARSLPSQFDVSPSRTCSVHGRRRCVPLAVFARFRRTARRLQIPFPTKSVFLMPAHHGPLVIPQVDLQVLDAFIRHPQLGLAATLRLYRGQTA